MIEIRKRLPRSEREPGMWEVSRDGAVIGVITEARLRHARNTFYRATGVHPATGERVNLELSTDFDDRVRVIEQLQDNPQSLRRHWDWGR